MDVEAVISLSLSIITGVVVVVRWIQDGRRTDVLDAKELDRRFAEQNKNIDLRLDGFKSEFDKYQVKTGERIAALETKIDPFWNSLGKFLHSPHTPETDILLESFCSGLITIDQKITLADRLEDGIKDGVYAGDKTAAAFCLIAYLRQK